MRRTLPYLLLAALSPANAGADVRLVAATVEGEAAERVSVAVMVSADAGESAGTVVNDIGFDPEVLRLAPGEEGTPDCAVEDDVRYFLSAFFHQPPGCDTGVAVCSGFRAAVVLFRFDSPPVTPRILYRCRFDIAADAAPGTYSLRLSGASYNTGDGVERPLTAIDGAVVVAGTPRTPLPTPRVLGPECTGDCDASGSVDTAEEEAVLEAIFDPRSLADCAGSAGASEPRAKAAHLLAAGRARQEGCTGASTPTPSRTRSGTATLPPSATTTASASKSPTRAATASRTRTPTPTITPTASSTKSQTRTRSPTATRTPTSTATPSSSATATQEPTQTTAPSSSATPSRTPTQSTTATRTPTAVPTSSQPPSSTPAIAATLTPEPVTPTSSATSSRTPTRSPTVTQPPADTMTPTSMPTEAPTLTYTATPTPSFSDGPVVTFFGIAHANGTLSQPIEVSPEGIPIFERPLGFGFVIVVEGGPGDDGVAVGTSAFDYDPDNPGRRPDLQILADRPLGDGSAKVCGHSASTFGGVQAVPSLGFEVAQPVSDAINDFGCRFIDGTGRPRGRLPNSACSLFEGGVYRFATAQSQIQFCASVSRQAEFSAGDTRLRVRLRNIDGQTGGIREIIVRSLN